MANPCDTVNEYGHLSESIVQSLFDVVSSVGALAEAVVVTLGMTLGTAGAVSDDIEQFAVSFVEEQGTLTEVYEQTGSFSNDLTSSGRMVDSALPFIHDLYQQAGSLTDSIYEQRAPDVIATGGVLSETLGPSALSERLRASATVSEALYPVIPATIGDAGALVDALSQRVLVTVLLAESASISDSFGFSASSSFDVFSDALYASDAVVSILHASDLLSEHAVISDFLSSDIGGAWSSPLWTFAASRWINLPFNSVAEIDGALYAASSQGLYRLGDEHDEQAIDAVITGGLTDFGDPAIKHVSCFHVGYRSNGTIKVAVGYIPAGTEQSFTYALPARPADGPTPGRAKLGRGMRSRYWRLSIANVDGADFTFYDGRLTVHNAGRRI